jgi:endonuclease/exonuclease/phosphatase family metal-dependent hydrolase
MKINIKIVLLGLACLIILNFSHAQTLPWGDDFENGIIDDWLIVDDEPFRSGPSNWEISNGGLYQTSNIYTTENELSIYKGTHAVAGNPEWSDYYFATQIYTSDDEGIGMLFRYQDEDNYYRFFTLKNTNNWGLPFKRLEKQVNGRFTTLAQSTDDIKIPGGFVGKIHVVGDSISIFEDNELLFAVNDETFDQGKIGLMCYANRGAIFDDVYVGERDTTYEEMTDPTIPAILTANKELSIKTLTLNIWVNGKICTPAQVADLILALDVDFAGLQECNNAFGNEVAALTGMHLAKGYDCYLYSKTPYTKINTMFIKGINAWTNIDSQSVSIYNFHIRWDEEGDRHARTMLSTFKNDPIPIQIAIGDFNDEHYSTQINIIEEHSRYCLSDLGWAPSQRVTWPAFGFYGGEGAQTIDLIFCNKESKGRAIEGEIMNTSPLLADHKPVWATLLFPANKNEIGPQVIKAIPFIGANIIEVWFDQDLDSTSANNTANYQITPMDGGSSVSVLQANLSKDVRRVRLVTSAHEYDKQYQIYVSNVTDEFDVQVMANAATTEYTMRENLLQNYSAEDGTSNWETFGGFSEVTERENQYPFTGDYFFTGEDLQDLSSGTQSVNLTEWIDEIDQGNMASEWNCYFATGYELLGEIRASRCEPYDEAEMIVEFVDENDEVLSQASSKRWDTLFWHPYGEITFIPPGTRRAIVHLNSYRKVKNGLSNDAAFDNVFFAVKKLDQPHKLGKNLLVNPSAETGDMTGWTVTDTIRARAHEDNKARPLSGYYMFSNQGISTAEASQEFDFTEYGDRIDVGNLTVKWGGYMRDYEANSPGEIKIEFYTSDGTFVSGTTTGEQRVAEWWYYDTETLIPSGSRFIKFIIKLNAVADEGVYFDFLHFILIDNSVSSVSLPEKSNEFRLLQNYPNPFNAGTSIDYGCLYPGQFQITIYNLIGQKIITLIDEFHNAGVYKINWDGKDNFGNVLPSGIYVYKLVSTDLLETRKMLLLR